VHPDKHSGDERAAQAFVAVPPLIIIFFFITLKPRVD